MWLNNEDHRLYLGITPRDSASTAQLIHSAFKDNKFVETVFNLSMRQFVPKHSHKLSLTSNVMTKFFSVASKMPPSLTLLPSELKDEVWGHGRDNAYLIWEGSSSLYKCISKAFAIAEISPRMRYHRRVWQSKLACQSHWEANASVPWRLSKDNVNLDIGVLVPPN